MSYIMPMVSTPEGSADFTRNGKHECVTFVEMVASPKIPSSSSWKKGKKVLDAPAGSIRYGTAIATFDKSGHYPTDGPGMQHAAIYISHVPGVSITVFEQYNKIGMVQRRTIQHLNSEKRSNNPGTFYIIE